MSKEYYSIDIRRRKIDWVEAIITFVLTVFLTIVAFLMWTTPSCDHCVVSGCLCPASMLAVIPFGLAVYSGFYCILCFDPDSQKYRKDNIRVYPGDLDDFKDQIEDRESSLVDSDDDVIKEPRHEFEVGDLITGKKSSWTYKHTNTDAKMRVIEVYEDDEEENLRVRIIAHATDSDEIGEEYDVESEHFELVKEKNEDKTLVKKASSKK